MSQYEPHPVEWTEAKVVRFWNYVAAHNAGEFFSEKHAHDIARFVTGRRVVDIGCGTGPLVGELLRRGLDAIGVDSSSDVLDTARRHYGNRFALGSVASLPYPDSSFDTATLIEVVEHLDDQTLDAAIREAHRIIRPGGKLVITTPNAEDLSASFRQCPNCGAEFHIYQHVRSWSGNSLAAYLRQRGFTPKVRGRRFVEQAPMPERLLRRAWYGMTRQRPRLLAVATRLPAI